MSAEWIAYGLSGLTLVLFVVWVGLVVVRFMRGPVHREPVTIQGLKRYREPFDPITYYKARAKARRWPRELP